MGAYAIFGPWGAKIMANAKDIIRTKTVIIEAVTGIAEGANPRNLEERLFNFLSHDEPAQSQFNK